MNKLIEIYTPAQLREAADIQEKILKLRDELSQILGATPSGLGKLHKRRSPRKMSSEAKAKIARAARKRWRIVKAAGSNRL